MAYRIVLLFAAAVCLGAKAETVTLSYAAPQVHCEWLEAEYKVLKPAAPESGAEPKSPGIAGSILFAVGNLLAAPVMIAKDSLGVDPGEGGGAIYFSDNPDELSAAAAAKNCAALLELIEADKRAGLYPPVPESAESAAPPPSAPEE